MAANNGDSKFSIDSSVTLNNGVKMPVFGLGTWRSDKGLVEEAVVSALHEGYRHIDAAFIYGNQDEVGRGIKRVLSEGKLNREDIFVVTKLWNSSHHPDDVEPECRKCLEQLQLDYIDLYLIHWPIAFARGEGLFPKDETGAFKVADIPLIDTYKAMEKLVEKGLVRSLGISNFSIEQTKQILQGASIKPVTNQVEAHPYFNQSELQSFLAEHGIIVTAYSPLGNLNAADPNSKTPLKDPAVIQIAQAHNKTPAQVLLRWGLETQKIIIPKTTSADRIKENAQIFDFSLTAEEVQKLNELPQARLANPPFGAGGKPYF